MRALCLKCFEVTNDTQIKHREFWKGHFNILNCPALIDNAWTQVTCRTQNSALKKLCQIVAHQDFEEFEPDHSALIDEVVSMGKAWDSKWKVEDVHELVKIHKIELNTDELLHLQEEQQATLADDLSSDEGEARESVPISLIKEMCAKWGEVQLFVEKYHPDTMLTNRAVYKFNDNAMMQCKEIWQRRQKQLTLDKFLVNKARKAKAEEEVSTASKRQRREITPK